LPVGVGGNASTQSGDLRSDPADWRTWWRYNGEAYVDLKALLGGLDRATATGANERFGLTQDSIDKYAVPALWSVIQTSHDTAMMRAAMLALARVESSWSVPNGKSWTWVAPKLIASEHQDTSEAAVVALGVAGRPVGIHELIEILRDSPAARAELKTTSVDYRRRALAAYALALIGRDDPDQEQRAQIVRALMSNLHQRATAPYDVQLASLIALGLVPLASHAESDADTEMEGHVCRGEQLAFLLAYLQDEHRHPQLRAQAVIPLARLAVGASDADNGAIRAALLEPLSARSRAPAEVQQSCVIALGLLGDADDDPLDRDIRAALRRAVSQGDRLSRAVALISLAKVVGRPGNGHENDKTLAETQELLLGRLIRGDASQRPWAALAIGVLGSTRADFNLPLPAEFAETLRMSLSSAKSKDEAGAQCLGLGLLRDHDALELLCKRLDATRDDETRGCAALALGLAGASDAMQPLQTLLAATPVSSAYPAAALALRLAGQRSVPADLIARAEKRPLTDDHVKVATILGTLGDGRALPALAALASDDSAKPELRAAAAEAIGELCDTRSRHWTSALSTDLHYGLLSSTLLSYSGNGTGILEMR
jgi:hypothetical protein